MGGNLIQDQRYTTNKDEISTFRPWLLPFVRLESPIAKILVNLAIFLTIFIFIGIDGSFPSNIEQHSTGIKNYNNGNYRLALVGFEEILKNKPQDFTALYYKGKTLSALEKYYEAITYFLKAEEVQSTSPELYKDLGYAYFQIEHYQDSLQSYNNALRFDPDNPEIYVWKANNYVNLGEDDTALELCDRALAINQKHSFAYNIKGLANLNKNQYTEANFFFDKAISINIEYEDAYVNKISALYYQQDYTGAMKTVDQGLKLFPQNQDIILYKAAIYSNQSEHDKAIQIYEQLLKTNPRNDKVITYIGREYCYLENYVKAAGYIDKALEINEENKLAKDIKVVLNNEKRPENVKVAEFIRENYLYFDQLENYKKMEQQFLNQKGTSFQEISSFVNAIKLNRDRYTFVISGMEYDRLSALEEHPWIISKLLSPDIHYVRIAMFTPNVDAEFKKIIDRIKTPEKKSLVIDLRDNPGGLTVPANNILDLLLPEVTISYNIFKDGTVESFNSDEKEVKFNKIFVLVNRYSASSSELLALGLKKHLNNVTIIGEPTVGKGVGQLVFENKARKYMIFLVSFYWNIKEKNIMDEKIVPDIIIKSGKDVDYLNKVFIK